MPLAIDQLALLLGVGAPEHEHQPLPFPVEGIDGVKEVDDTFPGEIGGPGVIIRQAGIGIEMAAAARIPKDLCRDAGLGDGLPPACNLFL